MKNLLFILLITSHFSYSQSKQKPPSKDIPPSATVTNEEMIEKFSSIHLQTIWFGSETDSVELAIVSPKRGWAGTTYLYQKKGKKLWSYVPLLNPVTHINSISGIADKVANTEHLIWIESFSLKDKCEIVSTYNCNLRTGDITMLSARKNIGKKY